jgi:hypothetical protein
VKRFAVMLAVVAALAGVAASSASALSWVDAICPPNSADVKICPTGAVGTPYTLQIKGRGGCWPEDGSSPGDMVTMSVTGGSLPPGLSLSSSGLISGTPSQAGSWQFYITEKDHSGVSWCQDNQDSSRQFFIAIDSNLRITTNDIPQTASVGQAYTATLQAQLVTSLNPPSGSTPDPATLTWTVLNYGTGLPPGLTLANGVIGGTPTTEGAYTFRIQASLNGMSNFQTYSLTIRQPLTVTASKPLAVSPAPTLWETGVPFSANLTASGGNGTYTYALADGTLPAGLALAADGMISGTPTVAGVSRATIRVTDGEGRTLDYAASFGVTRRLAVSTRLLKPGKVGRLYRARLATTGGLPPKTWRAVGGRLPRGVKLDRQLGVLSGVPRKAGTYRVTFQATDGLKVVAKKTLRIKVLPLKKKTRP